MLTRNNQIKSWVEVAMLTSILILTNKLEMGVVRELLGLGIGWSQLLLKADGLVEQLVPSLE